MSTPQGNSACRIQVDPSDADVLRVEAKKVLMFNHEPFEDFMEYVPTRQLALADIYRDATAVIDTLGWDPDTCPQRESVEVPLTHGHIEQLHDRRTDILDHNLDLLTDIGADREFNATVMSEIHANRHSVEALNRILTPTPTRSRRSPSCFRSGSAPQRMVVNDIRC